MRMWACLTLHRFSELRFSIFACPEHELKAEIPESLVPTSSLGPGSPGLQLTPFVGTLECPPSQNRRLQNPQENMTRPPTVLSGHILPSHLTHTLASFATSTSEPPSFSLSSSGKPPLVWTAPRAGGVEAETKRPNHC